MLYRGFGRMKWNVSVVGLGCWNIGNQWGEMSDDTAEAIVRAALDGGVNLFDVAESYGIPNGCAEMRLGRALREVREQVFIVSKIGHWGKRTGQGVPKTSADMIRLCGHACCGRLQTDHVDVMLCHDGGIDDPSVYIEGFRELRREGWIRQYGISTDRLDVLKRFMDASDGECAVNELNYSLVNRAPEAELLPYCAEQGIATLIRGPVAMGLLSGRYDGNTVFTDAVRRSWNVGESGRAGFEERLARVEAVRDAVAGDLVETALRYVISHPSGPVAIPGATSPEQANHNAAAGAALLPADIREELQRL